MITTRGTQSNRRFSRGNNVPATAWPNGFAFFTPVTDARTLRWVYSWSDHNDDQNRTTTAGTGGQPPAQPLDG